MSQIKKYAIMMIGKTHSGKTTLAESLAKKINGVVIQTDPINLFLKQEYPVGFDVDEKHDGSFREPSLKMKIYNVIFEHAIKKEKLTPILANSNMHQKLRDEIISKLKENNFKIIGIYLNFTDNFLLQRIKDTNKNTEVLNSSKSFTALLEKQKDIFIKPKKEEFDYFFEVTDEKKIPEVRKEIFNLIKDKF